MQEHHSARPHFKGLFATVAVVSLSLSLMIPTFALANPSSNEKQAEAQAALASLNSMQDKLNDASISYYAAQQSQQEAEAKCDEAKVRIGEADDKIGDLQDRLSVRARSMYRTGSTTMLDLLFGSTTFQAFASNWDILNQINQDDADLVQQTKDLRAEVQEQESIYAEEQSVAIQKAADAKRIQDEAQVTVASIQATYDGLSSEAATLLEEERAAQEAANASQAQAVVEASASGAGDNSGNQSNGGNNGNGNGNGVNAPSKGPSYSPVTGNAIVDRAYGCIGLPYDWGKVGPNSFDCSGLVSYAVTGSFSRLGTTETFMSYAQVSDPQPGDICTNWTHCGIYIGGGQMIHAPYEGQNVCVSSVFPGMIIVRPW